MFPLLFPQNMLQNFNWKIFLTAFCNVSLPIETLASCGKCLLGTTDLFYSLFGAFSALEVSWINKNNSIFWGFSEMEI